MTKNPRSSKATPPKRKKFEKISYRVGRKMYSFSQKLLQEIEMLQRSTKLCLRKTPFSRLCKEISMQYSPDGNIRWESKALEALQEAVEIYVTNLLEDANVLAQHAKRITLYPLDIQIALHIRGCSDPGRRT